LDFIFKRNINFADAAKNLLLQCSDKTVIFSDWKLSAGWIKPIDSIQHFLCC
jgi:hypothetical protein